MYLLFTYLTPISLYTTLLNMSPCQIEFEEKLAITDYKGNEVGHLEVCSGYHKPKNVQVK